MKFMYDSINIVVSGSREGFMNYHLIDLFFKKIKKRYGTKMIKIIHGGAKGVDSYTDKLIKSLGFKVDVYLPNYNKFNSRVAPIMRNRKMIRLAHLLVAFWDGRSKGTKSTIEYAKRECVNKIICIDSLPLILSDMLDIILKNNKCDWAEKFDNPYMAYEKLDSKFQRLIFRKLNRIPNLLDL